MTFPGRTQGLDGGDKPSAENPVPTRPAAAQRWLRHRPRSPLSAALADCRHAFVGIALFSAALKPAAADRADLHCSRFTIASYRAVASRRWWASAFLQRSCRFQGLLDIVRGRVLVRIAGSIDESLSQRVYDVAAKLPLKALTPAGYQPLHDLDAIRSSCRPVGRPALFDPAVDADLSRHLFFSSIP